MDTNIIDLIGKEILLNNFTNVAKGLGEGETLPFDVSDENLFNIISASNHSVRFHRSTIYLSISLPIIEKNQFKHSQVTTIPMRMGDDMWTLDKLADHILINKKSGEYMFVSDEDIKNCRVLSQKYKMCSLTSPKLKKSTCEFEAITFNVTKNCRVKRIETKSYIQRININTFIIIPFKPVEVFISCKEKNSRSQIFESDTVIELDGGSVIENEELKYSVNNEVVEDVSIVMVDMNESTIQIGDVIENLVEMSNKTVFFEESIY